MYKDFMSYNAFKKQNNEKIKENITKKVDEAFSNLDVEIKKLKKYLILGIIFASIFGVAFFSIGFIRFDSLKTNDWLFYVYLGIVIITIVFVTLSVWLLVVKYFLKKKKLESEIKFRLSEIKFPAELLENLGLEIVESNLKSSASRIDYINFLTNNSEKEKLESIKWIDHLAGYVGIPFYAKEKTVSNYLSVKDKNGYIWEIATIDFTWNNEYTRELFSTNVVTITSKSVKLKNKKGKVVLGERCGLNFGAPINMELEFQEFNYLFKPYSNSKLIGFSIFDPYSMEKMISVAKLNSELFKTFGMQLDSESIKSWLQPINNFLVVDFPKTFNKEIIVNEIMEDITYDLYVIYWQISMLAATKNKTI